MERKVATWFGTYRNALSGRNNRNNDGTRRLGDIIYDFSVVELKQHKTISMVNVPCVRDLAVAAGLPWLLVEMKKGTPNLVKLTMDHRTAEYVCQQLDLKWRAEADRKMALGGGGKV